MPLLDHFRPLFPNRRWESFHGTWSPAIMGQLNNKLLPEGYFAETQVYLGGRVEVDVASLETAAVARSGNGPATATLTAWAPPVPALLLPAIFPDEIEIQVFRTEGGATLVAAVELVSPANKDRPQSRRAFAAKCAAYLQAGVGLVVIDVVTTRQHNLHDELVELMDLGEEQHFPGGASLYTAAYRPVRRKGNDLIETWPLPLVLGDRLPVVPLALRGGPTLPLDLEPSYEEACRLSRL
jgi:hypothetical protein